MKGPYRSGSITYPDPVDVGFRQNMSTEEVGLIRGRKYRVVREFVDIDKRRHPAGEEWVLMYSAPWTYDDTFAAYILAADGNEWLLELSWADPEQAIVAKNITRYVNLL